MCDYNMFSRFLDSMLVIACMIYENTELFTLLKRYNDILHNFRFKK